MKDSGRISGRGLAHHPFDVGERGGSARRAASPSEAFRLMRSAPARTSYRWRNGRWLPAAAVLLLMALGAGLWTPAPRLAAAAPMSGREIARRIAALNPHDAPGHEHLAKRLYQQKLYPQALQQVDAALKINPHYQDAFLLKRLIQAAQRRQAAATTPSAAPAARPRLLTPADIDAIRLWELTPGELAGPGRVPLEARIRQRQRILKKFWRQIILTNPAYQRRPLSRTDMEHFIRRSNFRRQIYLMLILGNAYYWSKIQISSDPAVLRAYRTAIQPVVLHSCATAGCHRGQAFHGFKLFGAARGPTLRQSYTNFYMLIHYRYRGRGLIDYHNPRLSLVLQYLLPPATAVYHHPGKKGPAPRQFNGARIVQWIDSLRYPPHHYGFHFAWPRPVKKPR